MNKTILIVAAHPDDEILGCGGTIARLIREDGYDAFALVLGEGITARDARRDVKKRKKDLKVLHSQMESANKIIGVKEVFSINFPDNRFDMIPLLDIVKKIEEVKNKVKPQIIFTHFSNDLNIDHRITYQAVLTATRPTVDETVKKIFSFEIASSTDWNFPMTFQPNYFVDVSGTLEVKLKALEEYRTEMKKYPHLRSLEYLKLCAQNWGAKTGVDLAEAFQIVRIIKDKRSVNLEIINFVSVSQKDKEIIRAWRNDDRINHWMLHQEKITESEHSNFIRKLKNNKKNKYFLVKDRRDGRNLGVIHLNRINDLKKTAELGIYVNPDLIGQGVGFMLLNELKRISKEKYGLKQLTLKVLKINTRAISLYKKSNFVENINILNIVIRGKKYDIIQMSCDLK